MRLPTRAGLVFVATLAALGQTRAETLPIAIFTTGDGLPSNLVSRIYRDSRGFLWFGTREGLARFDGRIFVRFDDEHGIPRSWIRDLLETREGRFLVATGEGIYWFDDSRVGTTPLFRLARPAGQGPRSSVGTLFQGGDGTIWCGTDAGLARLRYDGEAWSFESVSLGSDREAPEQNTVTAITEDLGGALWVGTAAGVVRLPSNGPPERYTTLHGLPSNRVRSLYRDSAGTLWLGTDNGLCVIDPDPSPRGPVVTRLLTEADGLIADHHGGPLGVSVRDLLQTSDGRLWAATTAGLAELRFDAAGEPSSAVTYTTGNGLSERVLFSLGEDDAGNLWIGSESAGAMRLAGEGFTTFGLEDGLGDLRVSAVFLDRTGALCAVSEFGNGLIQRFDGHRFVAIRPNLPATISNTGWGWGQITFQDSLGEWWVPTGDGLCRFPPVESFRDLARATPIAVYTKHDGLRSNGVFRLFEDSSGDVWIGTTDDADPAGRAVQRWERATETIHDYGDVAGMPGDAPTAFAEDRAGNLWIGFSEHGVGRLRARRFELFSRDDGAPGGFIEAFHVDAVGRLWIATARHGAIRVDDPQAEQPEFTAITSAHGLSGDYVRCITEDRSGRLYLGMLEGVDRLDPATGMIRHFSRKDGLPTTFTVDALTDSSGVVWVGSFLGVSRLKPATERPSSPPSVWIQALRIAGNPHPLGVLGATSLRGLVVNSSERQVEIEVSGLSFVTGETLKFQYRLDRANQDWSRPNPERTIHFASLAPGRYRLAVRAVNTKGLTSVEPATVSFRVLPPFWSRWWFVTTLSVVVAGLAYSAHRIRLRRLLELERVRTRIATDLHDDIGASLSQVSILSEVVRQQMRGENPEAAESLLDQIAGTAHDLVGSMSDIVWAVNPKRDRAADLAQRMRRFASDTFSARGITLRFEAPENGQDRRLDLDSRRQVYLIFKEAVNNAVRHAQCTQARIAFRIDGKSLSLTVADNGRGFDATRGSDGHGLESMRKRAEEVGGELAIDTAPGRGTTVRLWVPIGSRGARLRKPSRRGCARFRRKP